MTFNQVKFSPSIRVITPLLYDIVNLSLPLNLMILPRSQDVFHLFCNVNILRIHIFSDDFTGLTATSEPSIILLLMSELIPITQLSPISTFCTIHLAGNHTFSPIVTGPKSSGKPSKTFSRGSVCPYHHFRTYTTIVSYLDRTIGIDYRSKIPTLSPMSTVENSLRFPPRPISTSFIQYKFSPVGVNLLHSALKFLSGVPSYL